MGNELPKSGLIVTPSSMAAAIADGRKTLLVKTKSCGIANREMLLLDRNKAIAVVKIGDEEELPSKYFSEHEDRHLITTEIRKDWSEAQPSWGEGPFVQWSIEVVEKFDEPIETSVEVGPAVVIDEVDISKRGPFGRWGGSARYAKWLVGQLPPHKKYVETFAGAASVFFEKEASDADVLADYDKEIVNAFKTIKGLTDKQMKALEGKDRVLSKDKWHKMRGSIPTDSLDRLHRLLFLSGGGWSTSLINYNVSKDGKTTYNPQRLTRFKERLNKGSTTIEHADWRATVKKHDSKDTLFFIDCPYPKEWDKKADDIPDDDPNRGESISFDDYAKVLKTIKGSYIFVLGDHKEHIAFLKSLEGVEIKSFTGTEAASSGGVKTAKRYFAFKTAGCSDKKPKKKFFDEVENHAMEFLDVTEDQHVFAGLDLTAEVEPTDFGTAQLIEIHKQLHEMYVKPPEGCSTSDVVDYHSLVVDELCAREKSHPAPPDNGLDGISFDFEHFGGEQPRWFELEKLTEDSTPEEDVEKRRLALWGSTAGKSRVAKKIVSMIPDHSTYVEPFAGGAAVFYAKEPSDREVLCDSNPEVVHAFKFVQAASEKEIAALSKMDWTVNKQRAKAVHEMSTKTGTDRFFRFAYKRYAMFFCNDRRITAIDPSKDGKSPDIVGRIPETKERLKGVTILDSYDKAFKKYDSATAFFYLDPPYPSLVQEVGEKSFDEDAFIKTLKGMKGKFLLHYEANAKKKFEGVDGWTVKTIAVTRTPGHTQGGGAPGKLLEVRNYELPKKKVKKSDLYLSTPEGGQPFTVQHHWIGPVMKSVLRIGVVPGRSAICWSMNTQRVEASEPVTTLAKSRELTEKSEELCIVDWSTGKWATKKKSGSDEELPVEVLCKRHPISSHAWLDIEAKTMSPQPGLPAPLGGSAEYPGVFEIVEKGVAEFGAQSDAIHEYFLSGSGFSGRTLFRMMRIRKSAEGACQVCGTDASVDVGWADSSAVKLCTKCYGSWQTTEGVEKSNLPAIDDDVDISFWFATMPQESTPFVLTEKAVVDEWMPADGVSALPTKFKSQVPKEFAYWDEAGIDAREMRDALVKAIQDGQVSFDLEGVSKSDSPSSRFVLQKQLWDEGDDPRWFVRIDTGKPEINVIELQSDPLEIEKSDVRVWVEKHRSSMDVDGLLSAAHYLNLRKGVRSSLTKIDSGDVSILSDAEESTQVEFSGGVLKGLFVLKRSDHGYLLERNGEDAITQIEKMVDFELVLPFDHFEISKAKKGKEKRLVTGIVLEPDMIDAQDDTIKATVIEKAAHLFLTKYNKETKLGLMHTTFGDNGFDLCQSFVAPVEYTVGKKKVKKGSWVMTVHVTDDNRWYDVKNRKLTGFSIGGKARMARKR